MMLPCIINVLARFPISMTHSNMFSHLHTSDFISHRRIHKSQSFCYVRVNNIFRRTVGVMNVMEAHSSDLEASEGYKERLLIDCGPDQQCVLGGIVALGKFDALHIGHRALAIQASKMGTPFLLSFTRIAEVLGWEKRLPIVAPCDRKRIMSLWTTFCGGAIPQEYQMEFSKVRYLSPREFVHKLAIELHVKGVVAGANYRFGYKAAGNSSDLVQLCSEYGLDTFIVETVMDKSEKLTLLPEEMKGNHRETGQVSSTRVRKALCAGDMQYVTELLGHQHRLILSLDSCKVKGNSLVAPMSSAVNQPPGEGIYHSKICVRMDENSGVSEEWTQSCDVKICAEQIDVNVHGSSWCTCLEGKIYVGLDLQNRISF